MHRSSAAFTTGAPEELAASRAQTGESMDPIYLATPVLILVALLAAISCIKIAKARVYSSSSPASTG